MKITINPRQKDRSVWPEWSTDTDSDDRKAFWRGMQMNRDVTLLYLMESEYLGTIDVTNEAPRG